MLLLLLLLLLQKGITIVSKHFPQVQTQAIMLGATTAFDTWQPIGNIMYDNKNSHLLMLLVSFLLDFAPVQQTNFHWTRSMLNFTNWPPQNPPFHLWKCQVRVFVSCFDPSEWMEHEKSLPIGRSWCMNCKPACF